MATKVTPSFSMEAWGREEVPRLRNRVRPRTRGREKQGAWVLGREQRKGEEEGMMEREGMEGESEKGVGAEGWGKGGELTPSMGAGGKVGAGRGRGEGDSWRGRRTDMSTHRNKK